MNVHLTLYQYSVFGYNSDLRVGPLLLFLSLLRLLPLSLQTFECRQSAIFTFTALAATLFG
jgi:hypothetical protein